ncbi:MAG: hypothetical protein IBX55_21945 [Methyloprofundus sp.]|nr:hypothetical protein [Methyloprofundus sp.]
MKKTLLLIGLTASLVMTGCASYKPLTEKDGYYKDYTAITNYERIELSDPKISVKIENKSANKNEIYDSAIIEKFMSEYLAKNGVTVEFSESAQYVVSINQMHRSDKKNLSGFNPIPSTLASTSQQFTGSPAAGAAGLGTGLLISALRENRMWLIDFSIFDGSNEHTRYYRLAPAALDKRGVNSIAGAAASEFFVLKK